MILKEEEVEIFLRIDGFNFSIIEVNRYGQETRKKQGICNLCMEKSEHTVFEYFQNWGEGSRMFIDWVCSRHLKEYLAVGWKEV